MDKKLTATQANLATALKKVKSITTGSSIMPIIENTLLEVLNDTAAKLTVTDLDTTIIAAVFISGGVEGTKVLLPTSIVEIILSLPPDADISFLSDEKSWKIETEHTSATFNPEDFDKYPAIPDYKGERMEIKKESWGEILEAFTLTSGFCSKDTLRPTLQCVAWQSGRVMGTNAHQLVIATTPGCKELGKTTILIPAARISVIGRLKDAEKVIVNITDNHVSFTDSKTLIITTRVKEKYPDLDSIIPENDYKVTLPISELMQNIKIAMLSAPKATCKLDFSFGVKEYSVAAQNVDFGYATTVRGSVTDNCLSEEIEISLNGKFLTGILSKLSGINATLELQNESKALLIREGNLFFLMMPLMRQQ